MLQARGFDRAEWMGTSKEIETPASQKNSRPVVSPGRGGAALSLAAAAALALAADACARGKAGCSSAGGGSVQRSALSWPIPDELFVLASLGFEKHQVSSPRSDSRPASAPWPWLARFVAAETAARVVLWGRDCTCQSCPFLLLPGGRPDTAGRSSCQRWEHSPAPGLFRPCYRGHCIHCSWLEFAT